MKTNLSLIVIVVIIAAFFYGCNSKSEMNEIKNKIEVCSTELIEHWKETGERKKTFDFRGEEFTMYIDTTGKPIFYSDGEPTKEITLTYEDEKYYSVTIDNGKIIVSD